MSYVTPSHLAEVPGARELAEVASTEHEAIVAAELMDLTLRGLARTAWSAAQVAAADEALARINQVIAETDEFVDGYLARRYVLPLASVPKILLGWARAIVRYRLHKNLRDDDRSNPVLRDYRDAVRFLEAVSRGEFSLGINDPGAAEVGSGVQFGEANKVFGRDELGAFR
jgi:phage gp36-like protein